MEEETVMDGSADETPRPENDGAAGLDPRFLECLICPLTHGPLTYDREASELRSPKARLAFPIRGGVPILLESEARELNDGEN